MINYIILIRKTVMYSKKIVSFFLDKFGTFFISQRMTPKSRVFGLDKGKSISRYYIDSFIEQHKEDIKGDVLEVGIPTYAQRYSEKIQTLDVLHFIPEENKYATIIGDLSTGYNIPQNRYDCFILTQTIQLIFEIREALRHAYNALKPGGVLLVTCSGISQISRYDMERWGEFWRLTDLSCAFLIKAVCPDAAFTIRTYGNVAVVKGLMDGIHAERYHRNILEYTDPDYQIIIASRIRKYL